MNRLVGGWVGEFDGWMHGFIDGWIDKLGVWMMGMWMDERIDGYLDGWMYG